MTSRIDDLLPHTGATDEATSRQSWRAATDHLPLAGVVKYDYPLTFYATSAMRIRMRGNIL